MATPPLTFQLQSADFAGEPWSQKFLIPFNQFTKQVQGCLTNGLTFSQNVNAQIATFNVTILPFWQSVAALGYQNSWVEGSSSAGVRAQYAKKPDGTVIMRGFIKSGTIGDVAFTLPAAYRPDAQGVHLPVVSNNAFGYVYVDTTGDVNPMAGNNTYVALDGSWMAGDPTPVSNVSATFKSTLKTKCGALIVLDAVDQAGTPTYIGALGADWTDNGSGTISIGYLAGVFPEKTYTVTVLALATPL